MKVLVIALLLIIIYLVFQMSQKTDHEVIRVMDPDVGWYWPQHRMFRGGRRRWGRRGRRRHH